MTAQFSAHFALYQAPEDHFRYPVQLNREVMARLFFSGVGCPPAPFCVLLIAQEPVLLIRTFCEVQVCRHEAQGI